MRKWFWYESKLKNVYSDLNTLAIYYSKGDNDFGFSLQIPFDEASIYDETYFWKELYKANILWVRDNNRVIFRYTINNNLKISP